MPPITRLLAALEYEGFGDFLMMRILLLACFAGLACAQSPDGAALFKQRCSACHDGGENSRAPSPEALRGRKPESIVQALEIGPMRIVGSRLSGSERRSIAEFITGEKIGVDVAGATTGRCEAQQTAFPDPASGPLWSGWGVTPTNTRFQSTKQAGLTAAQVPHLALKWAFGFPDASSAWAQPAVAGGRVFVGSQNGTVYSLDAKSGCIYWTFSVQGGARTGMVIGPREGGRGSAVYFGDTSANAYAVDAATGQKIWVRKVEEHPLARITGTPTLYEGRLYVGVASYEEAQSAEPDYRCCTFRGSLSALDVKTGAVLWKSYTMASEPKPMTKSASGKTLWGPAGAGIWSSPTVDAKRGVVYVATGNSYSGPEDPGSDAVLAFEIETGKLRWLRQTTPKDIFVIRCQPGSDNPNCPAESGPDYDFGNAPILATLANGHDAIVIGQKSGMGFALDPEKRGELLWQYRAGEGSSLGGMEWGSAVDADNAYFPVSDMTRPKPGGLHAVSLATGQRVWYAPPQPPKCAKGPGCNAAQSTAITVIPGVVFSPSNDGVLRAYSTKDGSIIWDFDTNREFQTVNGVPAKGASMIGPGPVIADGMVYVNSGYIGFGGRAGNVLLAFGVE
jgi:polyvinyl alcohol dehydrogenase (cytochrome)